MYRSLLDSDRVTADIPAGPLHDPWRLRILTQAQFDERGQGEVMSLEQLVYVAAYAVIAPTTHNTVSHRFTFDEATGSVDIWIDRTVVLPYSDREGRQTLVSLGCVIETLEKVAAVYGWETGVTVYPEGLAQVRPFQEGDRYVRCLRLSFGSGAVPGDSAVLHQILSRKVVRSEYDERVTLPSELVRTIEAYFSEVYPSLHVDLVRDRLHINGLAKIQEIADRTVIERDTFATELGKWLIPNTDTVRATGMRGLEFGFDDVFAQRMHDGLSRKVRLLPDEIAAFATAGKIMIKSASAICIISVNNLAPEHYVAAGRAYFHVALTLQQYGFVSAMHAAVAEVPVAGRMLAASLRTNALPAVLFRIGKPLHEADRMRPHSARPHLPDLVLE